MSYPRLDAKLLYRRLDSLFGSMESRKPQARILTAFLEDAFRALEEDLRLDAAFLYAEQRDGFGLLTSVGSRDRQVAEALGPELGFLALVFRHRVFIFPDPGAEGSPHRLGVLPRQPAAALVVGRRPRRYLLVFLLKDGWIHEELDFTLNTLRAALGARLTDERVRGSVREAARIQQSLLIEEPPAFPGYEIACRSQPAEEVGGDFYDFLGLDDHMLGIATGDASGHGLPAALVARDVVTGLRMGIEKDIKIPALFARLNRVIHRSNLSSRFVSLFYGEVETGGDIVYVNAGHPPPLVFGPGGITTLATGGTVIGPLPEVRFRRGFARLEPGSVLVLTTDGILERRDAAGEFFGTCGIGRVIAESPGASAHDTLERLFAACLDHGRARPWEDDATIVVVRREP